MECAANRTEGDPGSNFCPSRRPRKNEGGKTSLGQDQTSPRQASSLPALFPDIKQFPQRTWAVLIFFISSHFLLPNNFYPGLLIHARHWKSTWRNTEQLREGAEDDLSCPYFSFNFSLSNSLLTPALEQVNLLRVNIIHSLKKKKSKTKKPHSFSSNGEGALAVKGHGDKEKSWKMLCSLRVLGQLWGLSCWASCGLSWWAS